MFPLEDATIFRSSLVKGKCGPYIVIAFFICCMWKRLIPSYWGIMCPWVSGFLKTGKMEKALVLETCDCKTSNSESHSWRRTSKCKYEFNFHATKEGFVLVFCKYESVPRTYHYCSEEHCQFGFINLWFKNYLIRYFSIVQPVEILWVWGVLFCLWLFLILLHFKLAVQRSDNFLRLGESSC